MSNDNRWDHASVFLRLIDLKLRNTNGTHRNPYVVLYEQKPNNAILYSPDSREFHNSPLHLHPGRKSWQAEVYHRVLPAIGSVRLESKSHEPFLLCQIKDWA